jgi:hypothetical protein
MTKQEAMKLWINRDWSNIPGSLVERAFKENTEELELLAGGSRVSDCCDDADLRESTDKDTDEKVYTCDACEKECETHWSGAEYAWPAAWGKMFIPEDPCDRRWIENNADAVAALGFIVYTSDETGIILGIDGAGFDFYAERWMPLYDLRGFKWHVDDAAVTAREASYVE